MTDILKVKVNNQWQAIPAIKGRGIVSFTLISTVGVTKTYRMLFDDNTYVDIEIKDGTGTFTAGPDVN